MTGASARHVVGPSVIAAVAGVLGSPECREALGAPDVAVARLGPDAAFLAARFANKGRRPAFGADPGELLARQAAERYPRLDALRPVVVDVEKGDPEMLAARATRELVRLGRVERGET